MNDIPAGVDEKLLSVLIRPGAIEEIVATGVAPEHFIVPLYGSIYQWAIGYHRDHGVAPTKLAIETTWPPFQVEDAVEEAPKWLATALCKRARRNILNDTLLKAATNADDDPDGTWRWLAEKATAAVNRLENAGSEGLSLRRLCDVAPQRVEWLWSGYLPLGKLVVLDGDPDIGKSTLATGFAAVVSAGGMWPDRSRCAAADVLIMSAEENPEDIIRPRLDAAGGDPARVTTIEGRTVIDADGNRVLLPLTLADITRLREAIEQTGARLLIVDVLMAYLPNDKNSHRDQDIRRVLAPLSALAGETGCTVLVLRHLNKDSGHSPLYRGGGSIGIIGAARVGLLAAYDPDDEDGELRVLAVVKNNLARHRESLAYKLVATGDYDVACAQWCGPSPHTAESLFNGGSPGTSAEAWLREALADGPRWSAEIVDEAKVVDLTTYQLRKARKALKVATS